MKPLVTLDERRRITLPKDLGFRPGQAFALERTDEGILLRPQTRELSKANPPGGKHLRRKGGILIWTGPVPDVDPLEAVKMGRVGDELPTSTADDERKVAEAVAEVREARRGGSSSR